MLYKPTIIIAGLKAGIRMDSRDMEAALQKAVEDGHRCIEVHAYGQHGIGGRLWKAGKNEELLIRVLGSSGQRIGAMGFPGTSIDVFGPASDDVGWLNAGAHITIRGNATNGVGNAMAQGKIYVAGDIGARGMTMTKCNPRFEAPELWVLGSAGDSFAEFMAGGIAVICGLDTPRFENILGYRPCVGMVAGKIFFRGSHQGFSEQDAKLTLPDDREWQWLRSNMEPFLKTIGRTELYSVMMSDRGAWQILTARKPYEKTGRPARTMQQFSRDVWDRELGKGGLIGDLTDIPRSAIDVIATGDLRRMLPLWENEKHLPPCQAHCPTGIPVQKRWSLVRKGRMNEAVDLALTYTPFPATVCGYLCPNLCMQNCTRQIAASLPPLDVAALGRASLEATLPVPAAGTGKTVGIIGGGPAGLSVAWQLWMMGHRPFIYEIRERLGGKITDTIPKTRIPDAVVAHELNRVQEKIEQVFLKKPLTKKDFLKLKNRHDFMVIAAGAQKPRMIPVPGHERALSALEFLRASKTDQIRVGRRVVIIGAGNVGCDAASEAARLGAGEITLIDIQEPASFGIERKSAEAAGARFLWPRSTKAITEQGVLLTDGELLPADTVIISIGDAPDLGFLSEDIALEKGFVAVNDRYQSMDPQVFAIGDAVRPGLLTDAIGAGRVAARAMDDILRGRQESYDQLPAIEPARIRLAYYDSRLTTAGDLNACSNQCASCGSCRDCGLCESLCPRNAISRRQLEGDAYEYVVDGDKCIGCGFCAGACPCGIWELVENSPLE
jgi:NADPH-dependent glutamate synthase beta subunit-like oxidoreductase/glutamate synthase domain-containing protein 3/Pyruvate/2-oxoacid:ferredoxin oxidoreductase delta subunit